MIKDCICRQCGRSFLGGPRAWYCPDCRARRERERRHRYNTQGYNRHIGETDYCVSCGEQYTITAGNQKYCPNCAPVEIRKADAKQGLEYYHQNADEISAKRKIKRSVGTATRVCRICGKEFAGYRNRQYCSKDCAKVGARESGRIFDAKRRPPQATKVCSHCGKEYQAGYASKYCPDCRHKVDRATHNKI